MRTTITLDDDVKQIVDEARRPGESQRQTINRLIRASHTQEGPAPDLPLLGGTLQVDISDVSEVLARLDDR